jgi:hypothetical protein
MGSGSSAEYCLDGDFRKRPNDLDLWKEMIDPNEDKGQSPIGQRLVTTWATSNARRKPEQSTVGTVKAKKSMQVAIWILQRGVVLWRQVSN